MMRVLFGVGIVVVACLLAEISTQVLRSGEDPPVRAHREHPWLATPVATSHPLRGRVGDDARWLAEVVVSITSRDGEAPPVLTTTDPHGEWITELPRGRFRIEMFAAGYLPQYVDVEVPWVEELTTLLVRGGTPHRGRVRDVTGAAIAGARLDYLAGDIVVGVARSHADGTFETSLATRSTRVRVTATGHVTAEREDPSSDLELALRPGYEVQGAVTLPDGTPCAGAKVTVDGLESTHVTATADADGRFSVTAPRGHVGVGARGPGCRTTTPLQIELGQARALHVIAGPAHRVSGRAITPEGGPISGARVVLGEAAEAEAITDRDGRFVLDGVAPGEGVLVARHPARLPSPPRRISIAGDLDGFELVLPPSRGRRPALDAAPEP